MCCDWSSPHPSGTSAVAPEHTLFLNDSPFVGAQNGPSAPQDGQLPPDGKGVHFNVLCVSPLSLE